MFRNPGNENAAVAEDSDCQSASPGEDLALEDDLADVLMQRSAPVRTGSFSSTSLYGLGLVRDRQGRRGLWRVVVQNEAVDNPC